MCAFCAAVPATLAIGANLKAKQLRDRRELGEREDIAQEKKQIPAGKITIIAVGTLVTASLVYHTQFNG